MEFHALDLIMYIIFSIIIWVAFLPDDFKEELGCIGGIMIMMVYTIVYLILFAVWPNWNWIDIFSSIFSFSKSINITL